MAFNLQRNETAGGDLVPFLKYNAKAGRFFVKPANGEDIEVVMPVRLAIDMDNAKSGWIMYPAGSAPIKIWDTNVPAVRPLDGKFKRGFEVMVFGPDQKPGIGRVGLREWNSNAGIVCNVMVSMHEEWERERRNHPGEVPVYMCDAVKATKGKQDTNYEPVFKLVSWVTRDKVPGFPPPPEPTREPVSTGGGDWHVKPDPQGFAAAAQAQAPLPENASDRLNDDIPF